MAFQQPWGWCSRRGTGPPLLGHEQQPWLSCFRPFTSSAPSHRPSPSSGTVGAGKQQLERKDLTIQETHFI